MTARDALTLLLMTAWTIAAGMTFGIGWWMP